MTPEQAEQLSRELDRLDAQSHEAVKHALSIIPSKSYGQWNKLTGLPPSSISRYINRNREMPPRVAIQIIRAQ